MRLALLLMGALAIQITSVASLANAFTVTLSGTTESQIGSRTRGDGYFLEEDTLFPTTLPVSAQLVATTGITSAATDVTLTNELFEVSFDLSRSGAAPIYGITTATTASYLYFSVDQDVTYSASGLYSASHEGTGRMAFQSVLRDLTIEQEALFDSLQASVDASTGEFVLGGSSGNSENTMIGSLTGTLLAGHEYEYRIIAVTQSWGATPFEDGGTASGNASLTLTAIPEPGTGVLVAVGLLLLPHAGRSKRLDDSRS